MVSGHLSLAAEGYTSVFKLVTSVVELPATGNVVKIRCFLLKGLNVSHCFVFMFHWPQALDSIHDLVWTLKDVDEIVDDVNEIVDKTKDLKELYNILVVS